MKINRNNEKNNVNLNVYFKRNFYIYFPIASNKLNDKTRSVVSHELLSLFYKFTLSMLNPGNKKKV